MNRLTCRFPQYLFRGFCGQPFGNWKAGVWPERKGFTNLAWSISLRTIPLLQLPDFIETARTTTLPPTSLLNLTLRISWQFQEPKREPNRRWWKLSGFVELCINDFNTHGHKLTADFQWEKGSKPKIPYWGIQYFSQFRTIAIRTHYPGRGPNGILGTGRLRTAHWGKCAIWSRFPGKFQNTVTRVPVSGTVSTRRCFCAQRQLVQCIWLQRKHHGRLQSVWQ